MSRNRGKKNPTVAHLFTTTKHTAKVVGSGRVGFGGPQFIPSSTPGEIHPFRCAFGVLASRACPSGRLVGFDSSVSERTNLERSGRLLDAQADPACGGFASVSQHLSTVSNGKTARRSLSVRSCVFRPFSAD